MNKKELTVFIIIAVLLGIWFLSFVFEGSSIRWNLSNSEVYIDESCTCSTDYPPDKICIYRSKGDDIEKILKQGCMEGTGCKFAATAYKYCNLKELF